MKTLIKLVFSEVVCFSQNILGYSFSRKFFPIFTYLVKHLYNIVFSTRNIGSNKISFPPFQVCSNNAVTERSLLSLKFWSLNIHVKTHITEDSEKMHPMHFLSTCCTAGKKIKTTRFKSHLQCFYFQGYYILCIY